jgi:hypothetical protein
VILGIELQAPQFGIVEKEEAILVSSFFLVTGAHEPPPSDGSVSYDAL